MKPAWRMIAFALPALLWSVPNGMEHFADLSPATRFYYVVVGFAGFMLLAFGTWLVVRKQMVRRIALGGVAAALTLGVAQAAGMATGSILCYGAG